MARAEDYYIQAVKAAYSVLIEVSHLLGEYRDGIIIVGGWVPELLIPDASERHIGSLDVDLALDHQALQEVGYQSILDLLLSRGYQRGDQPFIFYRTVTISDKEIRVEIDFLTSEYGGTSKRHRTQIVQDLNPRKARGCDLAFEKPVEIILRGSLPDGGLDQVPAQVASMISFIMMKAFALRDRLKEKDAYDIYYCLHHYPPGLDHLVTEFKLHIRNHLVQEGLAILAEKFASPEHVGPRFVTDFLEISNPEDRSMIQRDAYERVKYILAGLGFV